MFTSSLFATLADWVGRLVGEGGFFCCQFRTSAKHNDRRPLLLYFGDVVGPHVARVGQASECVFPSLRASITNAVAGTAVENVPGSRYYFEMVVSHLDLRNSRSFRRCDLRFK